MNFSTSSNPRNPILRAGLKGTTFATSFIVKPEMVNLTNNNVSTNKNFLTITKSRVPDIQMINKYYGLVPKKFVINARSDFRSGVDKELNLVPPVLSFIENLVLVMDRGSTQSTNLRARTSHSIDEETSEGFFEENSVSKNKVKEFHTDEKVWKESHTPGEEKNGSEVDELVARKMPVEKHKKWKRVKNCGRSLSMMDNTENMGSTGNHHENKDMSRTTLDRMDIQRVIKIDLNNMRWEESYQEKSKTDGGGDTPDELSDNGNSGNLSSNPAPTTVKRGSLRKTISFDDQIMKQSAEASSSSSINGTKPEKDNEIGKLPRRPTTAIGKSSTLNPQPTTTVTTPPGKVTPWTNRTGQVAAERRSKFQKTFSIYQDSVDNGESDNESDFPDFNPSSALKGRESKKSLHVQPPPEISTMISLINPPVEEDLQSEIDKVASIINNVQTKIAEVEEKLSNEETGEGQEETLEFNESESVEKKGEGIEPKVDSVESSPIIPATTVPPVQTTQGNKGRKILQKAASISCENELQEPPPINHEPPNGKIRPQTSKGRGTVSFSNTTSMRFIPARSQSITQSPSVSISKEAAGPASQVTSETSQSQASKNRKILIKKALIEINQSSINLGKKFGYIRPKTAPIPEKKTVPLTTPNHHPKRQPLKARSPPIKMPSIVRKNPTLPSKMESRNPSKEASPEPPEPSPPKVRAVPRQSFSVTDGFVHGFNHNEEDDVAKDLEVSFLNSKKREECLKIYEKMMKKGCNVKLETIFRGMMTPSEYRMFLKATEMAEKNSAETNENVNPGDAGVSVIPQPSNN
ncbi:unnamed protein product [Allacma fusca]|uniref:Uncharacterized protein n=1 Tax=Allacma fusca TaxID=39272 RepID=A0A8J2LBT0_9HEXA|nr:unnamed protein product [Allacma fusca]